MEANKPDQLSIVLGILNDISAALIASLADGIVLAGNLGIEMATNQDVSFTPGRGDSSDEQTDVESFAVLEPVADGFRNYLQRNFSISPEEIMLDKAQLLGLSAPEMTALVGGFRSLGISSNDCGLFSEDINQLSNDFFTTLLDMNVEWKATGSNSYDAMDRSTGKVMRCASRTDLVFGSNSQLRAIAEVYAQNDGHEKFVKDFIAAWNKVMNADRFDVKA